MKIANLIALSILLTHPIPFLNASQEEDIAADIASMMRAYHQALTANEDITFKQDEYFVDFEKGYSTIHNHMKIYFKLNRGSNYPNHYNNLNGHYRKILENSAHHILEKAAQHAYDFKWEGKNEYIKKWDGLFLPARFMQLAADEFNLRTQGKVSINFTTSKKLLVNEIHTPDDWESNIIEKHLIHTNKITAKPHSEHFNDSFRYILPEIFENSCAGCHCTGATQEGTKIHASHFPRKVGDFGGAISITVKK